MAAKLPRVRFVQVIYLFLVANMLIFWFLLRAGVSPVGVARAFFVWITVFSVFTVSVFWSFMSDLYSSEQSKRLVRFHRGRRDRWEPFSVPYSTRQLVGPIGVANLLLVSSALLVLAVFCATKLEGAAVAAQAANKEFVAASAGREKQAVGGGMFDGFKLLFTSPYLGGIALWVFLLSLMGTFLYFKQADIVAAISTDAAGRTKIFATIALWVGILSFLVQVLLTGRVIKSIGTWRFAAALLPLVFAIGFRRAGRSRPSLMVVAGFQAVQRATNFGIANVARESLWTVVSRDEKFKAKNIVDGSVFRGADAVNGWLSKLLASLMSAPVLALVSAGIAAGWFVLSLALGRQQEKRARDAGK